MRVTLPMTYMQTTESINDKKEATARYSRQISSGERMAAPHEDPIAWGKSLDIQADIQALAAYRKGLDFAENWNNATEGALNHLHDLLIRVRELGIAANTPNSEEERNGYANELDQILDETINAANTQYRGRYVFNGATSTPPVDPTDLDGFDASAYQDIHVRNAKGTVFPVNVSGQDAFFIPADTESLFTHIKKLSDAIRAGDSAELQVQLDAVEKGQENIRALTTRVGARLASIERQIVAIDRIDLQKETELSETKDTDFIEAVNLLQQDKTVLEAALRVTSLVKDLNLAGYL